VRGVAPDESTRARSNHKCRDEKAVARGTAGGDKLHLESLQQVENGRCRGGRKPRAMECWHRRRSGRAKGREWMKTMAEADRDNGEVVHIASTRLRGLLMAMVWVLRKERSPPTRVIGTPTSSFPSVLCWPR